MMQVLLRGGGLMSCATTPEALTPRRGYARLLVMDRGL